MIIKGLQKTTLLDFPGKVAATVFLGGCNMRCPFCHNMNIADLNFNQDEGISSRNADYTPDEILDFLKVRRSVLDGVCITGGEPTINPELYEFIKKIKDIGLLVKLDTNGTNPKMVKKLIDDGLVDYVAMDIKSSPAGYETVSGVKEIDLSGIKKTINYLITGTGDFDYEFRTTIVKDFHDEEVMRDIGELIRGAKKYYLQGFKDSEYVPQHNLAAPQRQTMEAYVKLMSDYVKCVEIRGMD